MSIYALKSRFQNLLRPTVIFLAKKGITANQVTIAACVLSVILGLFLSWRGPSLWFCLLPLWLFIRMALNAIDGMLAREHNQQSKLGGFLNELCDVIADSALYLPFCFVGAFGQIVMPLIIFLAILSEYAGVMGPLIGGTRRYDGPMGKSDRAFVFGALGLWVGLAVNLPSWSIFIAWLVIALLIFTIIKRVINNL